MALLSRKKQDDEPVILELETHTVSQIHHASYDWLGERYKWYRRIRNADKGGLAKLFQGRNLEEQMQATRSALTLVSKTLKSNLVLAFNSTVDAVASVNAEPEGWPAKIEMPDRNNPPEVSMAEDTVIIAYMPLKIINLGKMLRDKGKGIDFYAEGVVKKLQFKVLGFYADPSNWDAERLGFMFKDLEEDADLAEVNSRLSPLKKELEMLVTVLQMFRFGGAAKKLGEAGGGNTLENTFNISDEELVSDLYFQSMLTNGMVGFLYRYFMTLMSAAPSGRATKSLANMFMPVLEKSMELKVMFQGSFSLERDKIRLRQTYQGFYKKTESLPTVETLKVKGRQVRKINYSHRLMDATAYAYTPGLIERHRKPWLSYLQKFVLAEADNPRTYPMLMEMLNSVLIMMGYAAEGKHKVSAALRKLADDEEQLGKRQVSQKKKGFDNEIAKKKKSARKFKVMEQFAMAETVEKEAEELVANAKAELEKLDEAIDKRRTAKTKIAENMDITAKEEKESGMGESAAGVYKLLSGLDTERKIHGGFFAYLLQQINNENDEHYHNFYLNLYRIMPNLTPMEKTIARKAMEGPLGLEEGDMLLTEEEQQAYDQEINNIQAQMEQEVPGLMEQRLVQGAVQAPLKDLLEVGITAGSMQLLLQLPISAPRKAGSKLPPTVVKQLLLLNQLKNPFPEHDLILPNVDAAAPAAKRLNLTRLSKLLA